MERYPPSLPQIQTTGARGNHQRGANVIAAWAPAHPITAPRCLYAEEIRSGPARRYLRLQFLPASFASDPGYVAAGGEQDLGRRWTRCVERCECHL